MTVDFSRIDAALLRANLWIAECLVESAFAAAELSDPLVAAEIAAMNALPLPGGE